MAGQRGRFNIGIVIKPVDKAEFDAAAQQKDFQDRMKAAFNAVGQFHVKTMRVLPNR